MPTTPYVRQADFVSFESENPTATKRGTDLDAEFDALKVTTDNIQANAALIQRDDGALKNASVHPDAFSPAALALLQEYGVAATLAANVAADAAAASAGAAAASADASAASAGAASTSALTASSASASAQAARSNAENAATAADIAAADAFASAEAAAASAASPGVLEPRVESLEAAVEILQNPEENNAQTRYAVQALAGSGDVSVDYTETDYFTLGLTGNVTGFTMVVPPGANLGAALVIRITQDATPRTVAWPASFKWAGGTPGVVSDVAGAVDLLAITTVDNGVTWHATLGKAFA